MSKMESKSGEEIDTPTLSAKVTPLTIKGHAPEAIAICTMLSLEFLRPFI